MGRQSIGPKHKINRGFSVDPDVYDEAKKNAGKIPLSSIIESLLIIYNKDQSIIKQAGS